MGTVCKNANFHGSETDLPQKKTIVRMGKRNCGTKNKLRKGRTGFTSAHNTHETYGVCSDAAITRLGCIIVNAVPCCYSCGLAMGLNAAILTRFCFWRVGDV